MDQSSELSAARAASELLLQRGVIADGDCVMLIGATVTGYGHARSDLDLLVVGEEAGRRPLHMFYENRRIDLDYLDPEAWEKTKQWVDACAQSVTQQVAGCAPPSVDDRDWWADRFWLYDRVLHGVEITSRVRHRSLEGVTVSRL